MVFNFFPLPPSRSGAAFSWAVTISRNFASVSVGNLLTWRLKNEKANYSPVVNCRMGKEESIKERERWGVTVNQSKLKNRGYS